MSWLRYVLQYRLLGPVLYRKQRRAARLSALPQVGGSMIPTASIDEILSDVKDRFDERSPNL